MTTEKMEQGKSREAYYSRGSKEAPEKAIDALMARGGHNAHGLRADSPEALYYIGAYGIIRKAEPFTDAYDLLLQCGVDADCAPAPAPRTWEDIAERGEAIEGFYINGVSELVSVPPRTATKFDANVFHDRMQAESALAMAKISQLLETPSYGGWACIGRWGFAIVPKFDAEAPSVALEIVESDVAGGMLRFAERRFAKDFLESNEELARKYLMV